MDPGLQFEALVDHCAVWPGVTVPTEDGPGRFGTSALKVNGSIFAMVPRGQLVVKLPAVRVDELVTAGRGIPFDANKGRPMKEWLTSSDKDLPSWISLAEEAYIYVGSLKSRRR